MVRKHIDMISGRREDSHKGDYGRVLVVAGSRGMTGAAFLCSQAVLESGSGLVTNAIPESLNQIMEIKLTEVMTLPLPETPSGSFSIEAKKGILDFSVKCDALAIGPGMGDDEETHTLIRELISETECPLVLDADGINALSGDITLLKQRPAPSVITPHPGEMARLLDKDIDEIQSNRHDIAKSVAEITGSIVCLKGHRTVVADPSGDTYINYTGNSGMATGGTGDVLTGMIASFIGQGVNPYSAAVSAVYMHGLSGDLATEDLGPFSVTATDLLDYLPEAFNKAGI